METAQHICHSIQNCIPNRDQCTTALRCALAIISISSLCVCIVAACYGLTNLVHYTEWVAIISLGLLAISYVKYNGKPNKSRKEDHEIEDGIVPQKENYIPFNDGTNHFENLPDSLQLKILEFINFSDFSNITQINQHFKKLAEVPLAKRKACFDQFIPIQYPMHAEERLTKVENLKEAIVKSTHSPTVYTFKDPINSVFFKSGCVYAAMQDRVVRCDQNFENNTQLSNTIFPVRAIPIENMVNMEGATIFSYRFPRDGEEELFTWKRSDLSKDSFPTVFSQGVVYQAGIYSIVAVDAKKLTRSFQENNFHLTSKNWPCYYFYGHKTQVKGLHFANNRLYSCSNDGSIKIWNVDVKNCIGTIDTGLLDCYFTGIYANANFIVVFNTLYGRSQCIIWSLATKKKVTTIMLPDLVRTFCIEDNLLFFTVSSNIHVIDLSTGIEIKVFSSGIDDPNPIFFDLQFANKQLIWCSPKHRKVFVMDFSKATHY